MMSGTRRPHLVRLANAPRSEKDIWLRHSDKALYAREITVKVLLAAGSADPASQMSLLPEYYASLPSGKHFVHVPNYPHGCGSMTHVKAFRMWIDHCFFERPLSKLASVDTKWTKTGLRVRAQVEGKPEVHKVELYYFQTSDDCFMDIGRDKEFPDKDHFTKAIFKTVEMQIDGRAFVVELSLDAPEGKYVALFVQAQDFAGKTAGYASSMMQWMERP